MKRVIHLLSCAIVLAALAGCRGGLGFGRSNQSNGTCCESGGSVVSSDVIYQGSVSPIGPTTTLLPPPAN